VRYGDDFAIACDSWQQAQQVLERIREWLGTVYLSLQADKTHVYSPEEEFIFLGHRFSKGQLYAPPPPPVQLPGWRIFSRSSGDPGPRPEPKPPQLVGAPLACDRLKPVRYSVARLEHIWNSTMTTLYVTDQGAYISVYRYQFQVFYQRQLRIKVPVNQVSQIVLFGCCNLSHGAVKLSLSRRIPILFLSQTGRYFGRLKEEGRAKVDYLMQQVKCANDPDFVRRQAEAIVAAKLHNSRVLLMRLNRRRSDKNLLVEKGVDEIADLIVRLPAADSLDALRGYEGHGATLYFQALGSLFVGEFAFEKRSKRPLPFGKFKIQNSEFKITIPRFEF